MNRRNNNRQRNSRSTPSVCDQLSRMNRKILCFYIADIVFLAFGIASLITGVWLYTAKNDFIELTPASYSALSAAGLCVFTGATIVIISLVGLFAVNWMNKYLIYSYIGFVFILLLVHSVTRLTGFFLKEEAHEHLRKGLLRNINTTYVVTKIGVKLPLNLTWSRLQTQLKCCGVDSYEDWFYSNQWPANEYVPDSCCNPASFDKEVDNENCGKVFASSDMLYEEGCYEKFLDWLSHHVTTVTWMSSFLIIVEVIVLINSFLTLRERKLMAERERRRLDKMEDASIRLHAMDRIGYADDEHEIRTLPDAISIDSR